MDDAVRLALADQVEAGLDIVTDGEQRRRHYIWGFCEGLSGIDYSQLVKIRTAAAATARSWRRRGSSGPCGAPARSCSTRRGSSSAGRITR